MKQLEQVVLECRHRDIAEGLMLNVRDRSDGSIILTEPIKAVAAWLKISGYKWVPGTSGIWKKGK